MQKFVVADKYLKDKKLISEIIVKFDDYNCILGNPERNIIKKIPFHNGFIVVKSFKKPHILNKIVYRYFRKSKAKRSFEHGEKLLQLGILNPEPIAYIENSDSIGLTSSYYISQYTPYDFTIREIYEQPDAESCLKAYAQFSYYVHKKGVYIKDNTPGNTLVKRKGNSYEMSLVDLNRMDFHEDLSFEIKMKSLSNNIKEQPYLDIFIHEYAKVSGYELKKVQDTIHHYQKEFNRKIKFKAKFKKILKKIFSGK